MNIAIGNYEYFAFILNDLIITGSLKNTPHAVVIAYNVCGKLSISYWFLLLFVEKNWDDDFLLEKKEFHYIESRACQ